MIKCALQSISKYIKNTNKHKHTNLKVILKKCVFSRCLYKRANNSFISNIQIQFIPHFRRCYNERTISKRLFRINSRY